MPEFRVHVARDLSEYASVTIDAENREAAEAHVREVFVRGGNDAAHCAFVNALSWETGEETSDERIVEIEALADEIGHDNERGDDSDGGQDHPE